MAGACDFNGINMTKPHCFYVFSDTAVDEDEGYDGLAGFSPTSSVHGSRSHNVVAENGR